MKKWRVYKGCAIERIILSISISCERSLGTVIVSTLARFSASLTKKRDRSHAKLNRAHKRAHAYNNTLHIWQVLGLVRCDRTHRQATGYTRVLNILVHCHIMPGRIETQLCGLNFVD